MFKRLPIFAKSVVKSAMKRLIVHFNADLSAKRYWFEHWCFYVAGRGPFLVRFSPHRPKIGPAAASACSRAGLIHKNRGKNPGYSRYKCLYFHIRLKNTGKNNGYSLCFARDFLSTYRHLTQQPKHTVKHAAPPCIPPSVRPHPHKKDLRSHRSRGPLSLFQFENRQSPYGFVHTPFSLKLYVLPPSTMLVE